MKKRHYLYKILGIHIPEGFEEDAQACSEVYIDYNLQLVAPPWPQPELPLSFNGLLDAIDLYNTLPRERYGTARLR